MTRSKKKLILAEGLRYNRQRPAEKTKECLPFETQAILIILLKVIGMKRMTEIEKMQRAKDYMDMLANGIDPISGMSFEEDAVLNHVRLSRCFFYVSDVLRQVIENGGVGRRTAARQSALPPFSLSMELRERVEITEDPVVISKFTDRLNQLVDLTAMKKLSYLPFTVWLLDKGFLFEEIINGKKRKKPSQTGLQIGIKSEMREGQYGEYMTILYTQHAQRFLLEHLDEILEMQRQAKDAQESS